MVVRQRRMGTLTPHLACGPHPSSRFGMAGNFRVMCATCCAPQRGAGSSGIRRRSHVASWQTVEIVALGRRIAPSASLAKPAPIMGRVRRTRWTVQHLEVLHGTAILDIGHVEVHALQLSGLCQPIFTRYCGGAASEGGSPLVAALMLDREGCE